MQMHRINHVPSQSLPQEDALFMTNDAQRVFDKLDRIEASGASVMADVARVQGAQSGMQTAINAISNAIGDVTEVKIESREMKVTISALEKQMGDLRLAFDHKEKELERRTWIENLIRYALPAAIASGGGVLALQHFR
jgi:phage-related tail protein